VHDEPYTSNYFGGPANRPVPNVTPLAFSMLPPDVPGREIVAWGVERADGGRGFGIVVLHIYKNWANDDLRTLILNGVVWKAGLDIPPSDVASARPDLSDVGPEELEFAPSQGRSGP